MKSLFDKLIKPNFVIVGEVIRSIRAKRKDTPTGPSDIFPSGQTGYAPSGFSEIPTNLNESGYYEVKSINIGITDLTTAVELIRNSASDSNFDSYQNISVVSLDGLFVPYSIDSNHLLLPHFEDPTNLTDPNSKTLNPFDPNNSISSGDLQSGFPSGVEGAWLKYGHNIGLATSSDSSETGITDLSFEKDYWNRGNVSKDTIRSVALRAPMILSGWGFDTNGDPVPASGGNFHPEAFYNPTVWKTGPVDLRWDDDRKVWAAGGSNTKIYLCKITNAYNPPNFSFEVDRSLNRSQYARVGPENRRPYNSGETTIYDPEYVAYSGNPQNTGTYEQLNYTDVDYPHYEAFIIRETVDDVGGDYYNLWTEDCNDCGHISNPCSSYTRHGSSSEGKKILIENPLRQNFDAGDLAFTVRTGRSKRVNTGQFIGGSGVGASGQVTINSSGVADFDVTAAGSGYIYGGFAIIPSGAICASISLSFTGGALASGTVNPASGYTVSNTYPVRIYPTNVTLETETLDLHWVIKGENKTVQVNTHVECDGGILQTCSVKLQSEYISCEWCGEDSSLINSF